MCSDVSFSDDLLYRYSTSNFSACKLLDFSNSRNPDSAKGPDNISYRRPLEQIEKLVSLLHDTLHHRVIPDMWRKIKVIPVPKKSWLFNYHRPICLLSVTVCVKCLESLIKLRMEEHINKNEILPPRSYAFKKIILLPNASTKW